MPLDVPRARDWFAKMRQRPGMYVPAQDWKYITAVAYIEGWMEATDPKAGREFSAWLGVPSVAWWATIIHRRYPDDPPHPLSEFNEERDEVLISDLFEALDAYLASIEA